MDKVSQLSLSQYLHFKTLLEDRPEIISDLTNCFTVNQKENMAILNTLDDLVIKPF